MLAEERFAAISQILEKQGTVSVAELTESLNVSESTIRRDLTEMHNQGYLKRVHGGATSIRINHITANDALSTRASKNTDIKQRLAQYAATLVKEDDFVFLDSGTTIDALIDALPSINCHFVTNNISSAYKLALKGNDVHLLGGSVDPTLSATIGSDAYLGLKKYNFTLAFFGVNGIHRRTGFSTPLLADAMIKQTAIKQCKKSYIIADDSKFDCVANVTFASLNDATIITTEVPDPIWHSLASVVEINHL